MNGNEERKEGEAFPSQNQNAVPPSPPADMQLRTMASDMQSLEKGEAMPIPQNVLPSTADKEPVFRPETQVDSPFAVTEDTGVASTGKKKIWLWAGAIVAILGVAAIGYFTYPLIFGDVETPLLPEEQPLVPPPALEVPPPIVIEHQSLFVPPGPPRTEIVLSTISRETATVALQSIAGNRLPNGTLQEVAVLDSNRSRVPLGSFMQEFSGTTVAGQLVNWFEEDFSAFLFYDADGVWPGYIAKVKNGVNLDEVKANISSIEASELSRFYLLAPGAFSVFRAGQVNGQSTRFAVGEIPGAAFNYSVIGNYLLISTSYNGLRTALPLLGL